MSDTEADKKLPSVDNVIIEEDDDLKKPATDGDDDETKTNPPVDDYVVTEEEDLKLAASTNDVVANADLEQLDEDDNMNGENNPAEDNNSNNFDIHNDNEEENMLDMEPLAPVQEELHERSSEMMASVTDPGEPKLKDPPPASKPDPSGLFPDGADSMLNEPALEDETMDRNGMLKSPSPPPVVDSGATLEDPTKPSAAGSEMPSALDEEAGVDPNDAKMLNVPVDDEEEEEIAEEDVADTKNNEGGEEPKTKAPPKKKREINPDFQDVQKTGKWGSISKLEMIIVGLVSVGIVVAVIVTVLVFVLGRDQEVEEQTILPATAAPSPQATPVTADERFQILMDRLQTNNVTAALVETFSDDPMFYEGMAERGTCQETPYECAVSWALYEDAFPPSSNDMVDRFAMAAFYYSLGGNDWKNNTNWLTANSYCDWYGLKCNRGETDIEELALEENNLVGEIPLELAVVDSLAVVSLKSNDISGALNGNIFASMPKLFVLYIQNNMLEGSIPDNLRDNGSLSLLFIHGNNFTGSYPSAYCTTMGPVFQEFSLDCHKNRCPEGCCQSLNCY